MLVHVCPKFHPFHPSEHVWNHLDRAVRECPPQPQTRHQLKGALQAEWMNIAQIIFGVAFSLIEREYVYQKFSPLSTRTLLYSSQCVVIYQLVNRWRCIMTTK